MAEEASTGKDKHANRANWPSTRVPTGKPRGRAPGQKNKATRVADKARERKLNPDGYIKKPAYVPTGKPKGRPPGLKSKAAIRKEQNIKNLQGK